MLAQYVVHSSNHQCREGAAFSHERWHPRCSHIRILCSCGQGFTLNITFVPSSITNVTIIFFGNWEAGFMREKWLMTTVHMSTPSSWPPYFPVWDKILYAGFLAFNPCSRRCGLTVWTLTFKVVAVFVGIKNRSSSCSWTISSSCSWDVFLYLPDPFFLFTVPSSSNFAFNRYNGVLLTANISASLEGLIPSWRCHTSL